MATDIDGDECCLLLLLLLLSLSAVVITISVRLSSRQPPPQPRAAGRGTLNHSGPHSRRGRLLKHLYRPRQHTPVQAVMGNSSRHIDDRGRTSCLKHLSYGLHAVSVPPA